jgi:dolichol-phosphate mannosyltransferase
MLKISFIIPVFNEVKTVKQAIMQIVELDCQQKEIIIVDNGSLDGSVEIIKEFKNLPNIKLIFKKKNTGYGSSIKEAISIATGDYLYIQYADLEYDHLSSLEMLKLCREKDLDVVFGSRLKGKINNINDFLNLVIYKPAYLATLTCTFLINKFYKKNFTDIIGTKFYKKKIFNSLSINSNGQGFDFELVSKISRDNFKIEELYVDYVPRKNSSEKKIKFYHIFIAWFEILKIKFF